VEKVTTRRGLAYTVAMWAVIAAALLFLYAPLAPPVLLSLQGGTGQWTLASYGELLRTPILLRALGTTASVALVVAVVTPLLALVAAQSIRELGLPRLILLAMLLPLFIPGISMGLATGFLFRLLGLPPSLPSIIIVQVLWALPFATLIILTAMSTFDPAYLEAAYMSGAERWQAFRDIELPIIAPGVFGAASFSFIISINETVRTSVVQGRFNTIATYVWSTYKQVGLSPVLHALMALVILATIAVVVGYVALAGRPVASEKIGG
jgi:ABC-type spermidine/putrescine transport system permease subunit II